MIGIGEGGRGTAEQTKGYQPFTIPKKGGYSLSPVKAVFTTARYSTIVFFSMVTVLTSIP